jgi:uncharacterized protein (TIGR04552 family)
MHENETLGTSNPVTSSTFKTAKFIVDIPIRLDDRQLGLWAPGKKPHSRVVHVLAEFQIVDQVSNIGNEQADARHDRYKVRKMAGLPDRLLLGKMTWNGKDSV